MSCLELLVLFLPLSLSIRCLNSTAFDPSNPGPIQVNIVETHKALDLCNLHVTFTSVEPCEVANISMETGLKADDGHDVETVPKPATTSSPVPSTENSTLIATDLSSSPNSSQTTMPSTSESGKRFRRDGAATTAESTLLTTVDGSGDTSSADNATTLDRTGEILNSMETTNTTTTEGSGLTTEEETTEPEKDEVNVEDRTTQDKDPARPVIFGCQEDLCNGNLEFTKEKRSVNGDMPKFVCLEPALIKFEAEMAVAIKREAEKESTLPNYVHRNLSTSTVWQTETMDPIPTDEPQGFFDMKLVFLILAGSVGAVYVSISLIKWLLH